MCSPLHVFSRQSSWGCSVAISLSCLCLNWAISGLAFPLCDVRKANRSSAVVSWMSLVCPAVQQVERAQAAGCFRVAVLLPAVKPHTWLVLISLGALISHFQGRDASRASAAKRLKHV